MSGDTPLRARVPRDPLELQSALINRVLGVGVCVTRPRPPFGLSCESDFSVRLGAIGCSRAHFPRFQRGSLLASCRRTTLQECILLVWSAVLRRQTNVPDGTFVCRAVENAVARCCTRLAIAYNAMIVACPRHVYGKLLHRIYF